MKAFLWVIGVCAVAACCAVPGSAKPEYAAKEKKACIFCHVTATGGDLGTKGKYYATNKHSLAGLAPAYVSKWRMDAPEGSRRASMADVAGDKKPRLITLASDGALVITDLSGEKPVKDATIPAAAGSDKFAVGVFAKGQPAIIAVPGAIYRKGASGYAKTAVADLQSILGTVKFATGAECLFSWDYISFPTVWAMDLTTEHILVDGPQMVMPDQGAGYYREIVARLTPEAVAQFGWPEEIQKAPAVTLLDARNDNKLYAVAPWTGKDGQYLVVVDAASITSGGQISPVWKSGKIDGKVLDLAVGIDPKGGKASGLLLLLATGAESKGRTLEFFALD